MVLFLLSIKANLEGVRQLSLHPDSYICISVRNPLSDFEVRERVVFQLSEQTVQDDKTRGGTSSSNGRLPPHKFALTWETSKKPSILTVLDAAATKAALKKKKSKVRVKQVYGGEEDSGTYVPMLAMECRGMEPYAFHVLGNENEFVVESEGGTVFQKDVDLSDGDWADYDEANDLAISISDFEAKFESV